MKIISVETFTVRLIDEPRQDDYRYIRQSITRIKTDEGVTGYGFRPTDPVALEQRVRPRLIGSNPMDIEQHLHSGALRGCPAVEHALWDIVGKIAGLPVRNLLGSVRDTIPYYLTCVWPGNPDQSHVGIEEQAEQIARYCAMGHTRIKIRAWRPNPMDDVRVFEAVRKRCGGRDKIELMLDRTAQVSGWVWTYEQALEVARGMEAIDATWLEEPFARDDLPAFRRLKDEVDIPITGAELSTRIETFRDYLVASAVDIIQPDAAHSGGIWPCHKVGVLAEAFGIPCILHGSNGPDLSAFMQVAASIPSCRMMEMGLIFPPLTPQEILQPFDRILKTPTLYHMHDGIIDLPKGPGLGIDLDEAAVDALRE